MKKLDDQNQKKKSLPKKDYKKIINDLEHANTQLISENFQLKNLIDSLPGDIYWKDKKGIWSGVNKRGSKNLQKIGFIHDPADVIGKSDYDLFSKETADEYRQNDLEVMGKKIEITNEETNVLPSGEKIIQLSTKRPLWDKDGNVVGVVGNSIDISYLKKIEAELKQAKEKAEIASHAKTEFIANMSHDIRTPLSGIIGISSLLKQTAQTPKEKEYAHMVNISGEQLLALLNSVLEIISTDSPIENMVSHESMNIKTLLNNLTELTLPTVTLKNIELKTEADSTVPEWIISDPVKLHRILLNLLGNAIKFTDQGQVLIHATCSNIDAENATLEFFVRDTGIGIKKEAQSKIFGRFYRVNPSYKSQNPGFGVGLHIVQHYVELLQGEVGIESILGQGSTFKVRIPVTLDITKSKSKAPNYPPSPSAISAPKEDLKNNALEWPLLLLVEDNPIALKIIESVAQQAHCRFISANSGEQALELVTLHEFDLIISDIGLSGISGYELSLSLRELEKAHGKIQCPIIGLSAHNIETTRKRALSAGMNKVIIKPIRLETLQNLIHEFIPSVKNTASSFSPQTNRLELPLDDAELFQMEPFSLLDVTNGMSNLGSSSLLNELLELMIHRAIPEDINEIKHAYQESNWKQIEKTAHKIKSGALYCGTVRLKYACHYLEHYHKSGEKKHLDKLYQQLCGVAEQTTKYIYEWLAKNPN